MSDMAQAARATAGPGLGDAVADGAARPHRLRAAIVDQAWMQEHRREWDDLAAEAASPNPFYAPLVLDAHVAHGLLRAAPRFAVARRGTRLVAVLPLEAATMRLGWLARAAGAVHSPYMVSASPLVAPDGLEANLDALLDALALAPPGPWVLPLMRLDDDVGRGLRTALARRGWAQAILDPFARAVLDRRADLSAFEATLPSHRRKDLRRRRRRLSEMGRVALRSDGDGVALGPALEAFLALEAAGWKGARGSALGSRPETSAYARALTAPGRSVRLRLDTLMLDGRVIAASMALVVGGTAYLYKTAYDETLARFAPGILLEEEIVRAMHESGFAERLNSASIAGSLLDGLYPDREEVGDLVFSSDPATTQARLDALVAQERRVRGLARRMKDVYRRLRGGA